MSQEISDEDFTDTRKIILTLNDLIEPDLHSRSSKGRKTYEEPGVQQIQSENLFLDDNTLPKDHEISSASGVKVNEHGEIVINEESLTVEKTKYANQRNEVSDSSEDENENYTAAPKVKVNENGEIVIDEQSLVVQDRALNKQRRKLQKSVAVNTNADSENGFYTKPKRCKRWTKTESVLFYKSLNTLGSDFHAMTQIFPGRSRAELKRKFNSEDKRNPELIDTVMTAVQSINITDLKKEAQKLKNSTEGMERRKSMRQELKTCLQNQIPYSKSINRPSRTKRLHQIEHKPMESKKVQDVYSSLEKDKNCKGGTFKNSHHRTRIFQMVLIIPMMKRQI